MRIFLFLLIPFILFGQTYIHNIPCADNAASTVVTNNGTSGAWVASGNTSTLYTTDYSLNCFKMQTNGMYIKSPGNLTISEFYIQWQMRLFNATSADYEVHFDINGDGGGAAQGNNEIQFWRYTAVDEFTIRFRNSVGTQFGKTTTNVTGDNTTVHTYLLYMNIVTFDVRLWIDGVEKSWGSWSATPAGTITLNQGLIYMGDTGTYEPDAYYKNIKFWGVPSLGKQFGFPHYKIFGNFIYNGIITTISTDGSTYYQFPYTFPINF